MTEKKTSKNILLIIMGVLILALLVERLAIIQTNTVAGVAQLISLVFTGLYGFWLYRKPHGNMLKYAMLLFACANLISGSSFLLAGSKIEIVRVLASAAACYCAGRLNRIDQNKYLMPIIGVAFLAVSVYWVRVCLLYTDSTLFYTFGRINFTINYLTLMIAYFTRYKEHREAGLQDAPKK